MNSDLRLTSVKLHPDIQEHFKMDALIRKFTLQQLVNRSMHLFVNNPDFRDQILGYNVLMSSGSL